MVVSRLKLSIGRRVGHIQLCLSEEGAEGESPERTAHNRRPLQNGLSPKKRCFFGRDFAEHPRWKELRVRAKGVCFRT